MHVPQFFSARQFLFYTEIHIVWSSHFFFPPSCFEGLLVKREARLSLLAKVVARFSKPIRLVLWDLAQIRESLARSPTCHNHSKLVLLRAFVLDFVRVEKSSWIILIKCRTLRLFHSGLRFLRNMIICLYKSVSYVKTIGEVFLCSFVYGILDIHLQNHYSFSNITSNHQSQATWDTYAFQLLHASTNVLV